MLILVRHAMPAYEQTVSPVLWPLSAEGLAAARALPLPAAGLLAASDEVKAWQTLSHAGDVIRDPRLREVHREGEPWDGSFRELRRSYVEGARHERWEPRESVAARFEEAVADLLVRAGERPLVVATHGMAMTVWLDARGCVADPGAFWSALRFPEAIAVDLDRRTAKAWPPG